MSSCTSLSTQLKTLINLHQQLADVLNEGSITKAQDFKSQIEKATKDLERSILSNQEHLIKEKLELNFDLQLSIYNKLNHTHWSQEILSRKEHLIKKIFNNLESTIAKYKEGMRPILMPGRETQIKDWEQSLKQLKPYWREKGKPKELNDPYIWTDGYREVLSKPESWNQIPTEPYIVWTKPSQTVDPKTTNKSVDNQKKLIAQKHTQHPNLYDATDLHPLEYASLQVMHTYQLFQTKKLAEDIIPLDKWGSDSWTRFISPGLSASGGVLDSYFNPGNRELNFNNDDVGPQSGDGFRVVGRL